MIFSSVAAAAGVASAKAVDMLFRSHQDQCPSSDTAELLLNRTRLRIWIFVEHGPRRNRGFGELSEPLFPEQVSVGPLLDDLEHGMNLVHREIGNPCREW